MESLQLISERLLKYSTPFGHVWVALTFLCRLIPAVTIGDAAYGDEQSDFECVTTQPGCKQMCYTMFAPISHVRFWAMQILILSFPTMIFSMVAANYNATYEFLRAQVEGYEKSFSDNASNKSYVSDPKYVLYSSKLRKFKTKKRRAVDMEGVGGTEDIIWAPALKQWYVIHLFAKLVLEMISIYLLYLLQVQQHITSGVTGFWNVFNVPFKYACRFGDTQWQNGYENFACSQDDNIPCWVSRPMEKKMFLVYMLLMNFVAVAIVLCDFFYVLWKVSVKKHRQRKAKKALQTEEMPLAIVDEKPAEE